ncbi:NAD(+)--dinitrogen-reductase ADP-D-ribosyltransferase [Methylomonas sp. AM2-LC]|uniref:NAD(+)--dinitrogen-reductase ADP-D-ribosyltransferase n=1 Tax=Methylomonas sp. AM2-LC TaxID=3153301 RepID=UPI00326599E6
MSNNYLGGYSSNLLGISTAFLACEGFNVQPGGLHIAGTREAAVSLFAALTKLVATGLGQTERSDEELPDNNTSLRLHCGRLFQAYMCDVFGYEDEQKCKDASGRRRYRNSYLSLIQDWGLDSNNAQAAVLKGWVESRFGLFPSFHKQPINSFMGHDWLIYCSEKMHSRYHNNCIYMQLDLLYEYCQWVIEQLHYPARSHKTLYRGVNTLTDLREYLDETGPYQVLKFNSLVSFTDRRSIASEFGAYILEVQVPMSKLMFFNELLPQHALHGEAEYLVIGGDYRVRVLR